jgi:cellulose synthase/poly-beta-1,6-N-acetylglucosamine synthase-like glycosyltransferase
LPPFIEVIVAPPGLPRTKPRALNVALPLLRGQFTVVYDAEDVPDPGQLRLAAARFAALPPDVACLQGRLGIYNAAENWLTRLFAIEYASLFDVVNPGLLALGFPIPLGGTSNHLRTAVLDALCGWDAWNVTEDADLGIRLGRMGYRVADLPSLTLEEAPVALGGWMRQRSRWMKGFIQTCITHSREPVKALRQLGLGPFCGAVTMTLGAVLSALGYPIFTVLALVGLGGRNDGSGPLFLLGDGGLVVFALGMAGMIVPAAVALKRRRLWSLLAWVPLLPVYYALVSIAARRAVWELVRDPFRWNKTDHGLARAARARAVRDAPRDPAPPLPAPG